MNITKKDNTLKKYLSYHHLDISNIDGIYVYKSNTKIIEKLNDAKTIDAVNKIFASCKLDNIASSTEYMDLNEDGEYEFNSDKMLKNFGNYSILFTARYIDAKVKEENQYNENFKPTDKDYRYKILITKNNTKSSALDDISITDEGVVNPDNYSGYLMMDVNGFGRETYFQDDPDKFPISFAIIPIGVVKSRKEAENTCRIRRGMKTAFCQIKHGRVDQETLEIYFAPDWNNELIPVTSGSCII